MYSNNRDFSKQQSPFGRGNREGDFSRSAQQQNSITSKIGRNFPSSTSVFTSVERVGRDFVEREVENVPRGRERFNKYENSHRPTGGSWQRSSASTFSDCLVLQAQLRDVKAWSKYKGPKLDLLFDLYVVISSEFGVNEFGGITFLIRDSTDSLKVVFYEIDSEMPEVKQDDWVRIGLTPRTWGFQVTSVKKLDSPTEYLTGLYDKLLGSRMALERRLGELNRQ